MKTNKQSRRLAKQLFRACLVDGLLDEGSVEQAARAVAEANRRDALAILSHFHRLVEIERAQHTAKIESAVPLSPALQASIQAGLTRHYGPGLSTLFTPNPALIGGMRIKVGSDVLDGSIQTHLAALEESF